MHTSFLLRLTFGAAASILLCLALSLPAVAAPGSVNAGTVTPRRACASAASLVGLCGVVGGAMALARGEGHRGKPRALALVAGAVSASLGFLVIATAQGGFGTGQGLAGGIVAVVLGLLSVLLAARGRPRPRRQG